MGGAASSLKYILKSEPNDADAAKYVVKRAGVVTSVMLLIVYGVLLVMSFTSPTMGYAMRGTLAQEYIMFALIIMFGLDALSAAWVMAKPVALPLLVCTISNGITVLVYLLKEIIGIVQLESVMHGPYAAHVSPTMLYVNVLVMVLIVVVKGSICAALGLVLYRVRSGVLVLTGADGQTMAMVQPPGAGANRP